MVQYARIDATGTVAEYRDFDPLPAEAQIKKQGGLPVWRPVESVGHVADFDAGLYELQGPVVSVEDARVVRTWTLAARPDLRAVLQARIGAAAEAERLKYITPGAGQAMVYRAKFDEALAALATIAGGGTPQAADHPFLQAEVDAGAAADLAAAANLVKATADQWTTIAAAIETVRRKATSDVAAAADDAAAEAVVAAIVWPAA